jgi:hypothetical protein
VHLPQAERGAAEHPALSGLKLIGVD